MKHSLAYSSLRATNPSYRNDLKIRSKARTYKLFSTNVSFVLVTPNPPFSFGLQTISKQLMSYVFLYLFS
jgi:hypothetical protein